MSSALRRSVAPRDPDVPVFELRARSYSDLELEYFFNLAECQMGVVSNFNRALGPRRADQDRRSPEDLAEAARKYWLVRGWLRAISDADAGVLQAAYVTRTWPRRLRDELGTLTGVVVRLACSLDAWPDDRASQELVEMVRAGWLESECEKRGSDRALATLRRQAEVRFTRAIHAYEGVRGIRPCLVRAL